ncbi:hypothetical protein OEZ85_014479 [Tetradesmus obliquus]|uniref:Chromo domain-containing protein n=1 Tax=Tetradesmus obliquus TaxID=3088 RepID=A0ABY8UB53_TETOB|nr:hypothetical protein OEZ85_014479 [Tetradesmus obliquus]
MEEPMCAEVKHDDNRDDLDGGLYAVEKALFYRDTKRRGREYLVKWAGYHDEENSCNWVRAGDMTGFTAEELVDVPRHSRRA